MMNKSNGSNPSSQCLMKLSPLKHYSFMRAAMSTRFSSAKQQGKRLQCLFLSESSASRGLFNIPNRGPHQHALSHPSFASTLRPLILQCSAHLLGWFSYPLKNLAHLNLRPQETEISSALSGPETQRRIQRLFNKQI